MKRRQKKRKIIPGFGLSFGITVSLLGLIVIIPLCTLILYSVNLSFKEFVATVTRPRVMASYYVSFITALTAAFLDAVFGTIIAWTLVRYEFPGKYMIDKLIELPFALPTAVAGISFTHLTAKDGWIGKLADNVGIEIAYTKVGITVALIFVGIPFVVRAVEPVLKDIDPQYEEAADILGASRKKIFATILLPEILPAILGGFTLSFARGLGEYGSVVFIAGNQPYKTEIAPLVIMSKLQEFDYGAATSIALVMMSASFLILLVNAVFQSRVTRLAQGM